MHFGSNTVKLALLGFMLFVMLLILAWLYLPNKTGNGRHANSVLVCAFEPGYKGSVEA